MINKIKLLGMTTVVIGMVMLLPACGERGMETEVNGTEKAPPASAQTGGAVEISITPPAGWEPVAGSVYPVHYTKNSATFIITKERFQSAAIDDVVMEAKNAFAGAFEEVQYAGEAETISVAGMDARRISFTCKVSGLDMQYVYVYLFAGGGGDVYAITFGDLADSFDVLSADYEQILEDIRFN